MKVIFVKLSLLGIVLLSSLNGFADGGDVYFIPTIHKYHKENVNYTYDSLKLIIERLKPDVIAVEIRPEDINADSTYLASCYPYEMRIMRAWFPKARIVGFDWLGKEVEGQAIPDDYWDNMELKKVERQLQQDSVYLQRLSTCRQFMKKRIDYIKNYSLEQLLNSDDAELTRQYYACLEQQLKGSPYYYLAAFYAERDRHILQNIKQLVKTNKGKRIVILTGGDHYGMLKDKFPNKSPYLAIRK